MFEWCEGSGRLQEVLDVALSLAGETSPHKGSGTTAPEGDGSATSRLLVVGCGTSALSADLWAGGCRRVHSVDVDADAIQTMSELHPDCEGLTWEVLDLIAAGQPMDKNGADLCPKLECEAYNLAVDKGTLDYFLCGEAGSAADALAAVHSALAPEGVLLVVSIHPVKLMNSLLAQPELLGFSELESWSLPADIGASSAAADAPVVPDARVETGSSTAGGAAKPTAALVLRRVSRPVWTSELRAEAARHIVEVLDAHFCAEMPFLTAQREAELRHAFEQRPSTCADAGSGRLSLEEAHRAMFPSPAEQAEYTLELFLEDLHADERYSDASSLSLSEALDFLQRNQ